MNFIITVSGSLLIAHKRLEESFFAFLLALLFAEWQSFRDMENILDKKV